MLAAKIGMLCLDWIVCLLVVDACTSDGFMGHLLRLCRIHTQSVAHSHMHVPHTWPHTATINRQTNAALDTAQE